MKNIFTIFALAAVLFVTSCNNRRVNTAADTAADSTVVEATADSTDVEASTDAAAVEVTEVVAE